MRKRLLSALLAMAMLLTMLPVSAFAVEPEDGESATPAEVVPANLTYADDEDAPAYGHAEDYDAVLNGDTITVTANNLEQTANADQIVKYWVGIGLPKTDNVQYMWGFGEAPAEFTANDPQPGAGREQTVDGQVYTTLYWQSSNWNAPGKVGYVWVREGDSTDTKYKVEFNVKVNAAVGELQFFADGAKANAVVSKDDCEKNTMVVPYENLAVGTKYALTLVYPTAANHVLSKDAIEVSTGNKEELINEWEPERKAGSYYFSLDGWEDSANPEYKGLAADEYTVNLYVVEGTDSKTYTKVNSKSITLAEVTVDFGEGKDASALIDQHESKAFFEVDEEDANVVTFYVNAADLADVSNAATTLAKFISVNSLTGGVWTYTDTEATKTFAYVTEQEINAVEVEWSNTAINVGGTLPEPEVTTDPAEAVNVTVTWKLDEVTVTDTTAAGDYVGTITLTPKAGFKWAGTVAYKLNNTEVADAEALTVTVKVEEVSASDPVLTVNAATGSLLGKTANDLQSGIEVTEPTGDSTTFVVEGISKYVTGWTEFSSNVDEQKGNYVALKLVTAPVTKINYK